MAESVYVYRLKSYGNAAPSTSETANPHTALSCFRMMISASSNATRRNTGAWSTTTSQPRTSHGFTNSAG